MEDYLEHKLVLPLDQEFELYEYEVSPEEAEAARKGGIQQCGLKQKTDQEGTEVFLSLISVSVYSDYAPYINHLEEIASRIMIRECEESFRELIRKMRSRCDDKYAHDTVMLSTFFVCR